MTADRTIEDAAEHVVGNNPWTDVRIVARSTPTGTTGSDQPTAGPPSPAPRDPSGLSVQSRVVRM